MNESELMRILASVTTGLLGLNLWFLRRLLASFDAFKADVRRALYGDADAPGILTRLALMEREQRRQGGSVDQPGVIERLALLERARERRAGDGEVKP